MANRKRKFVLRVPVTPEERALIQQKMAQLGTKNFSAYARKMLIDGYIVHIDTGPVRAQTAELQKIGVNINQIARRINSTGTVYAQDLEDIKDENIRNQGKMLPLAAGEGDFRFYLYNNKSSRNLSWQI